MLSLHALGDAAISSLTDDSFNTMEVSLSDSDQLEARLDSPYINFVTNPNSRLVYAVELFAVRV